MSKKAQKPKIKIVSDGTLEGTKVTFADELLTDKYNVVGINFYADASVKSRTTNEKYGGYCDFTITTEEKNKDTGVRKLTRMGLSSDSNYTLQPIGKTEEVTDSTVTDSYFGRDMDTEYLITKIIDLSTASGQFVPTKEELLKRTQESLYDKMMDLQKEVTF